jgi:hypothetical protein
MSEKVHRDSLPLPFPFLSSPTLLFTDGTEKLLLSLQRDQEWEENSITIFGRNRYTHLSLNSNRSSS